MDEYCSPIFRIALMSDSGVGKTQICYWITEGKNSDEQLKPTIGMIYYHMQNTPIGEGVVVQDTSGNPKFRPLYKYKILAHVVLIVYDVSNREAFDQVESFASIFDVKPQVLLLVGNTVAKKERQISLEEGSKKAEEIGMYFIEVNTITGEGLEMKKKQKCFIQ